MIRCERVCRQSPLPEMFRQVIACVVARVRLNADNTKAARIAMTPMVTSNSIKVNAREALIEYALRRMSMAYHSVWIAAKHFFQDLPAARIRALPSKQAGITFGVPRLRGKGW